MGIWEQTGSDVRLDWGAEGVAALGRECAVLVVVDVLSFSTTTDLVVGRGGRVLPVRWRDERGVAQARAAGAVVAGEGGFTLRPSSVTEVPPGTLLALPSPNGATLCAAAAATGARVLAGCLRNASAVAAKAAELGGPVGLIAAGERWGVNIFGQGETSGPLRPCVEDQLGAGTIAAALAGLGLSLSAEAAVAARSVDVTALASCVSGRELIEAGHGGDVALAGQTDVSDAAPVLNERSTGMTGRWIEVADGVHARRYEELDLTVGLVVGAERCLVVDTRGDVEQGAELAAAVRELTPLPWAVAYTHAHFDHTWGTERFLPCEIWAHERCAAELSGDTEAARASWMAHYRDEGKPEIAEAIARTTITAPDHTFTGRVELDLGGRTAVLLHPGRAHTDHDVVVHVPDAAVVFAGDVVEHAGSGFTTGSFSDETDLTAWPDALDAILALEPRVVVPGHGEPVDAEFVRYHREGLHELITLKAGVGRGETTEVAAVAASRYPSDVTLAALATP